MNEIKTFPKGFLWGAATSAYQIEGAATADGKGESIWDRFCKTEGKVLNGDTGDVACDHYNRYEQDIQLMQQLGLVTYRFSLAWTRIQPDGRGAVNQKGLDFYKRILDALREAGIQPSVTLFHWDLPQTLQDEGGWAVRSTAEAFAEYADIATRALDDGTGTIEWTTHNEPQVSSFIAHWFGYHAPGATDLPLALKASHHILLSHGLGLQRIRANCPKSDVGIVLDIQHSEPADDSPEAYNLYRHWDGITRRWFLDPVFGRGYPQDIIRDLYDSKLVTPVDLSVIKDGDEATIGGHIDYIGINYYNSDIAVPREQAQHLPAGVKLPLAASIPKPNDNGKTEMGWNQDPEGIFAVVSRVYHDYRPRKIFITENGCSFSTAPDPDGRIRDTERINYHRQHLLQLHRAIQAGVPVVGYFAWSLMDNFEWSFGYAQRFGLIWVDFKTQERIFKDSAHWYKDVIASNGVQ